MHSKTGRDFLNLLGFCMKAGKLLTGADGVMRGMKGGKVHLVLLASDTAVHTDKKVRALARALDVPLIATFSREEMSQAIGRTNRTVLGVTDEGFAGRFSALEKQLEVEQCQK